MKYWYKKTKKFDITILIRAPVGKIDRQSIDADGSNSTEKAYEGYW
eukprot:SAG31_NODE_643_length_13291_cov_6.294042_13_plen_45_part_01